MTTLASCRQRSTILFGFGFNAFGNTATDNNSSDLFCPTVIFEGPLVAVDWVGWASTILTVDGRKHLLGCSQLSQSAEESDKNAKCFGNNHQILGYVPRCIAADSATSSCGDVSMVVAADNGHIVAVRGGLEIQNFQTVSNFNARVSTSTYTMAAPVKKVCAGASFFAALDERGEVYTWGSNLHSELGRDHTIQEAFRATSTPISQPGLVDSLLGVKIEKLVSCGHLTAAVSDSQDLYIWGWCGEGIISLHRKNYSGPVREECIPGLVDLGDATNIIHVGVGQSHMIALTDDCQVWAVGSNSNGQLGSTVFGSFETDWVLVDMHLDPDFTMQLEQVWCGPRNSFILYGAVNPVCNKI